MEQISLPNINDLFTAVAPLQIIQSVLYIALIIFGTYLLLKIRYRIIIRAFRFARLDENKKETLVSLLMSSTRYILYIVATLLLITVFVPMKQITPILAGAGVVGLAIGFGAQSLVKDIITGFFIMFEDQFHVGDYVEINDSVKGTIEEMGLRMTTIREWSGKKFYIANSNISTVRNYNREELRAIVYATFPYEENPARIREILEDVCRELVDEYEEHFLKDADGHFIEPPQVYGVADIHNNERGGTFIITAKTLPASLWTIEKFTKEIIWRKCNENNVQLAYPRRVLENVRVEQEETKAAEAH
jgi:small conductance mechanosensitive channel